MRYPWPVAGPGRATRGRPTLQTSSNHHDLNRLTKTPVTNVVNPSPKTTIISEKALRLTTFVTTDQKSTQKTPWIDDVCNNTPPATLQRHSAAGVEGAGGTGGPDCGARGRRRSLAGRPVGGRRYKRQHTRSHWCGGRRRDRRAILQCPWAAAGPGRTTSRRTEPHVSTPGPTGVEGAGGSCRGAGGRRRDLPRCRWAPEGPAAVPVGGGGAWPGFEPTHPATRQRPGPTGVEGAGGSGGHGRASRSTTPSRRLACGDLAGGRARRRPEHQRSHKQQHTARTARGRAAAHRHTQRPGPPAPETPVGPQAARPTTTTQRNEAATGCPATASSRSRSAVHNSATSNQAVMST